MKLIILIWLVLVGLALSDLNSHDSPRRPASVVMGIRG